MSLKHVTGDLRGVARSQRRRDAKSCSHDFQVGGLLDPHRKTGIAEVLYPKRTAAAVWILVHDDRRIVRKRQCEGCSKCRDYQTNERSACHPIRAFYHLSFLF